MRYYSVVSRSKHDWEKAGSSVVNNCYKATHKHEMWLFITSVKWFGGARGLRSTGSGNVSCTKSEELNMMRTAGSPFSVSQDWRQWTGREGNSRVFLSFPSARHGFFVARSLAQFALAWPSWGIARSLEYDECGTKVSSVVESDKCGNANRWNVDYDEMCRKMMEKMECRL